MIKQLIDKYTKPKVVFESLIPGIERLMPIVEAKDIKHQWARKALADYRKDKKHPDFGKEPTAHVTKCPGIFNLQRHGWVLRTWQDLTIETYGDGVGFNWTSPMDQKKFHPQLTDFLSHHPPEQLVDYMENWPDNAFRSILKINTPWRCFVPKGYVVLEMPVAYSDENRFTTLPGFFNHDLGPAPLNVQLMWHVLNGKTLIKAGTPIAQYILVPKDKYEAEIRSIKKYDDYALHDLLIKHRFVIDYAEMKKIFQ